MAPWFMVGAYRISTYWFFFGIAILSLIVLIFSRRKRYHLSKLRSALFSFCLLCVGIFGVKALYAVENWQSTLKDGITLSGMSFFGSVLLIPAIMPVFGKCFGLKAKETLDISAPCVVSMVGFVRFGCFLNGCCGGVQCSAFGGFIWPVQLIESLGDFIILGVLLSLEGQDGRKGNLYPVFLLSYCPFRFLLEFIRSTPKDWIGLSHGQWFAVVGMLVGGALLIINWREKQRKKNGNT